MSDLQFLSRDEVLEIQRRNIDEFGGIHGLRDKSAFESALWPHKIVLITMAPV